MSGDVAELKKELTKAKLFDDPYTVYVSQDT